MEQDEKTKLNTKTEKFLNNLLDQRKKFEKQEAVFHLLYHQHNHKGHPLEYLDELLFFLDSKMIHLY